jgi:hypothetical protein
LEGAWYEANRVGGADAIVAAEGTGKLRNYQIHGINGIFWRGLKGKDKINKIYQIGEKAGRVRAEAQS